MAAKKKTKRAHHDRRKHPPAPVVRLATKGRLLQMLEKEPNPLSTGPVVPVHRTPDALMISVSGIRGIVGTSLTPDVVARFASAFGTWANHGAIVVGRDSRVSGEMVRSAVVSGLAATGCKIIDIGITPTPTVEIAVKDLKAHGGIAITASHNPVEWNALKFIGPRGLFLTQPSINEVQEIAENAHIDYVSWDGLGKVEFYDFAVQNHLERILDLEWLSLPKLQERRFKVVVDCVNGASGVIAPKLLERLGCDVVTLHVEPHGIFPRNPEPTAENLATLEEAVRTSGADIGFAIDPDGDRLAVVSEQGRAVGEELTLALAVQFVLSRKPGPVVVNASTTQTIDELARRAGVAVHRTKIGEIHVATVMQEVGAVIGGEGNGGVILPQVHYGRDACTGMALIIQHMVSSGQPVSRLVAGLPLFVMKKRKMTLQGIDLGAALDRVIKKHGSGTVDLTDGVKLLMDKAWIHFRKSNTEPVLRIIAEAKTEAGVDRLLQTFTSYFQ